MHARSPLAPLAAARVVATPAALDLARWPASTFPLRLAPDETLVVTVPGRHDVIDVPTSAVKDPHATIVRDTAWMGVWMPTVDAITVLQAHADWEPPTVRPSLAQGLVAGLAVKVWMGRDMSLLVVPAALQSEFEARVR